MNHQDFKINKKTNQEFLLIQSNLIKIQIILTKVFLLFVIIGLMTNVHLGQFNHLKYYTIKEKKLFIMITQF